MSYSCPRFPRKGWEAILLQGLLPPLCSQVLRLRGISEGELPDCSQWHLASRVLRLRSEPLTSDHTRSSDSHTSPGINEKDSHTFALFATFWPWGWWKPYVWWFVAVDMMQINQGEPCFSVWVSFTFFSTYFWSIWSKTVQFAASLLTNTLMSRQLFSMKYCQETCSDIELFLTENIMFRNFKMKYCS